MRIKFKNEKFSRIRYFEANIKSVNLLIVFRLQILI